MAYLISCQNSNDPVGGEDVQNLDWQELSILAIDTFLSVENRGLDRILAELNGHAFEFSTDSLKAVQNPDVFWMPRQGEVTMNIAACMRPKDNRIRLNRQGAPGTEALVVIGDLLSPGNQVEYVLICSGP